MTDNELQEIKERIINGGDAATREEAISLAAFPDIEVLCDAADEIRARLLGDRVDSCSIVNARSGRCGEDCKWCAQASRHHTGCATYNILDEEATLAAARHNEREGIRRFSLVTSGRSVAGKDLDAFCQIIERLSRETDLYLCASMGLLDAEAMKRIAKAGIKRYHCNMETAADFFPTLCTTHTPEEKRATIRAAREAGLDVCSGGIIGMGETMAQRIDLALELRELGVDSVPMNILNPIPGTPLENTPPIPEEDIIRTAAVWRFILPGVTIRFAGGRMRLSHESTVRLLHGGINGVLMGDMLTTVSNDIASDRELFRECGLSF